MAADLANVQDLAQKGWAAQWGSEGRDDLALVKKMGGNAVHLYHAFGSEENNDHGSFLQRLEDLGMHALLGFHTQNLCPDYNCFKSWKSATAKGLKLGMQKGSDWHPSIAMLILAEEPDNLNFGDPPSCVTGEEAKCRVRAMLSAMDGVLAAEQEAGINASKVNLTVAWSSATRDSIDGKVKQAIGYYGFQDMVAGVEDPSIADYSPVTSKADLKAAFASRWTHGLNTASEWSFVEEKVLQNYKQFEPTPWFLSAFRGDDMGKALLQKDLSTLDTKAQAGGAFMGAVVYTFQADYQGESDPSVPKHGLLALGNETVGETGEVCKDDIRTKEPVCKSKIAVKCLTSKSEQLMGRGAAVAGAWKGSIEGKGVCKAKAADSELVV